jgi:TolB-like protein/DNA-binding winged helix-turn-helix (wHTH) protein
MTKNTENLYIGEVYYNAELEVLRDAEGHVIDLRPQTLQVLSVLLAAHGELVKKETIMQTVWRDTFVTDDSLVQCISEIRKALGPENGALLKTVPRQGYKLRATVAGPNLAGLQPENTKDPPNRRIGILMPMLAVLMSVAIGATWIFLRPIQGTASPNDITIAVLPFANLNKDPDYDYLSSGLAEDLLTDLSRIRSINVISRSTTFAYTERTDPIAALAAKLPITHVIDGTVRRDGDRLRISVQLVDSKSRISLWDERYDREIGGIFALQDEVRRRIFSALALKLAPEELARFETGGTAQVAAYDLLLRGRQYETSLSREGVARAIAFYEQALAIDPGYVEAIARLANMYDFSARFVWDPDPETASTRALKLAETAVALDPDNPFARWTYARVLSRRSTLTADSITRALAEIRRAIEIAPNYADAFAFISLIYSGLDQPDAARAAINTAFRLNPNGPSWYMQNRGIASYMEGNFAAALSDFETSIARNSSAAFAHTWLAAALAMSGRIDDAEWEIEEALSLGEPPTIADTLTANSVIFAPKARQAYTEGLAKAGLPD